MRTSAPSPSASSPAPGARTVSGVLDSQRPTVAVAGKNRARGSSRSLQPVVRLALLQRELGAPVGSQRWR